MRLINKTTICAAALGLILLYIIRKRRTADERPVSNDDAAAAYASVAESGPVASVPSATHTPADAPADVADPADDSPDTQADAAPAEPPPASEVPPKSPVSPQCKPSAPPSPKRQRQPAATRSQPKRQIRPAARTQSTRRSGPPGYMGRRIPTGVYYPPLSTPTEKASLRCRLTAGEWEIYLALPQTRAVVKVTHGGDELLVSSETELSLSRFTGDAVVHYQDNTADRITLLNTAVGKPLFFKMQENWEGEGRLVNNPTQGYVVAIAPLDYADEWDADEPHDPEECVDENFEARFLFLEGATLGRPAPMRIKGKTLHDDADIGHHGKLYIEAPPELRVDPQITDARIVEETGVRALNRWGENFNPHRQSIADALDGREGKFSIRTYHDGDLQESKPFRYFPTLRCIAINGKQHRPGNALLPDKRAGEHGEIALRFELNNGAALRPESVSHDEVRVADDGAVIIPPSPSIQTIICDFPNRASIVVTIPRVWWRMIDEDGSTGNWGGETYEFSRNEFMNIRNARIEIRMPPGIKAVEIGFGDETMNERQASQGAVAFNLWGFADYKAVEDAVGKDLLLNIRVNGQTAPIVRVLTDVASGKSAADKALMSLLDMYKTSAMPSAPARSRATPSIDWRTRGAHDVRLSEMKRKRPYISNKKISAERGVVILVDQDSYMLEVTTKSGQSYLGILHWDEMTTMTEAERAKITVGQELPVCVIKEAPPGQSAELSVDKLTDANYNAGED